MKDSNLSLTSFSTKTEYDPRIDLHCNHVIIDGLNETSAKKIRSWKQKKYKVQLCLSFSWGNYSDYLNGKWDEKKHWTDVQTDKNGNYILHGPNVPYFVPTLNYLRYLCEKIKPMIDSGLSAVQFQEPDFWIQGGYSEAFQKEWRLYYKTPWQTQESSPEAAYKSAQLKRYLFARAIFFLSAELKDYAAGKQKENFKIYIKTRGFLHNAVSGIVSPLVGENSAILDGYFVNISPKAVMNSQFDHFLISYTEYNILKGIVKFNNQEIHFAINPDGDRALLSWDEYKISYEQMLIAALLNPEVSNFQLFSKPHDIFLRENKKIPQTLVSEILVCANAITQITKEKPRWQKKDHNSVGIFLSETMMFQSKDQAKQDFRNDSDALSSIFGLIKPLFQNGMAFDFLLIENIRNFYKILNDYNVAILSYDFMKVPSPDFHYALQAWIKSGGILIFVGRGEDNYNDIKEWWQFEQKPYQAPEEHLFELLGILEKIKKAKKKNTKLSLHQKSISDSIYEVGKGIAAVIHETPDDIFNEPAYTEFYLRLILTAAEKKGVPFHKKNHYILHRGPYVTAVTTGGEYRRSGFFVSLFDSELNVTEEIKLSGCDFGLFYDIDAKQDDDLSIIAIGAKTENIKTGPDEMSFTAYLPQGMSSLCRIYTPHSCQITINDLPVSHTRDTLTKKTVLFPISGCDDGLEIIVKRKRR